MCHETHDIADVRTDAFLQLKTLRDSICDAGDLRKTDDAAARDIADCDLHIVHQCDVMLAVGKDVDVFHHDHIALRRFEGLFKFPGDIFIGYRIISKLLRHHVRKALRGLDEAFACGIIADSLDDEPRSFFQFL
ncbi:Uncharacterised protein [Bacteroides xylanisolvens]|nr:Uncharacterised protein [Bacteroides xylanisolvens]